MSVETLSGVSGAAVPTVGSTVGSVEIATPVIPSVTGPISSIEIASTIDINGGTSRPGISMSDLQSLPEHSVSIRSLHPDVSFVTQPITKPEFSTIAHPNSVIAHPYEVTKPAPQEEKTPNPLTLPEYRIRPGNIHIDRYVPNAPIFNPDLFQESEIHDLQVLDEAVESFQSGRKPRSLDHGSLFSPIATTKPQPREKTTIPVNQVTTLISQQQITPAEKTTRPQEKPASIGIETLLNPFTWETKSKGDKKVLGQNEIPETQGQQPQTTDLVQIEVEVETQAVLKLASQILESTDLENKEKAFFMDEVMKVAATKNLPMALIENLTRLKLSASPKITPSVNLRNQTIGRIEDRVDLQETVEETFWKLYTIAEVNHVDDTGKEKGGVKIYGGRRVKQSDLEPSAQELAQKGARALIKKGGQFWKPIGSLPFKEPQEAEKEI